MGKTVTTYLIDGNPRYLEAGTLWLVWIAMM